MVGKLNGKVAIVVGASQGIGASIALPMKRIGASDDVAPAAVFFGSDDSMFTTGDGLFTSGGMR